MSARGSRDRDRRRGALALLLAVLAGLVALATFGWPRGGPARTPSAVAAIDAPRLTLSIHMHFRDKYVWREDWPVAREITRQTGIGLRNVASSATTSSREAFNLMLAAGDLPDIVGGDNLRDDFIRYGMEGAFRPLDDLIAAHAPRIRSFFAAHPEIARASVAPDGHLYFIPYLPDGTFARGWFIRADWLDKLGLAPPRTVDELHAVLAAFRDRDPNGNGRRDEVPLFMREWPELLRLLLLWDARSSGSETPHDFYVEAGRILHPYTQEAYRTGIRNIARWYKEGLIDPQVFTRGARAREVLLGNDLSGMTHDWFASTATYNAFKDRIPGFRFVPIPPPASVSGRRVEESRRAPVRADGWAITTANTHAVETIGLFDFFFTDAGRRLINFGVEGRQYTMVDGQPRFLPKVLASSTPVNSQLWAIGAQIPIGFPQDYEYERQWTDAIALAGIESYERGNFLVEPFLGVSMTPAERRVFQRYWPTVLSRMLARQQAWILGTRDVDADWSDYVAQLRRLHYDEVLAAMQSAYDRQRRH